MRKIAISALTAAVLAATGISAMAQAPKGPADCKPTEQWDPVTKTCIVKK